MAEYTAKDASGTTKYFKAQNTGGSGDGFEQDVNVTDRAARDLGKVDIAAFDAALPAGTNNIGDVDIASALPAGSNTIGAVDITDKPARDLGKVDIAAFDAALPAGTNNIGDVDVLTGATDDAAAAGQIFPAAGLYQSTVDEVDAGDVGRLRMSARRGLITAPDYKYLVLDSATPTPAGSDILDDSLSPILAADFQIRDTASHIFYIPIGEAGYKNIQIGFFCSTAFDQALDFTLQSIMFASNATLMTFNQTFNSGHRFIIGARSAVGVGGTLGSGTFSSGSYYAVPAMENAYRLSVVVKASVAPTTGDYRLAIFRST